MSLGETVNQLDLLLTSITKDLSKVGRGNKAASQRVRVGTLSLEKIAKKFRKESVALEKRKKLKKKSKVKKRKKIKNRNF